MSCDLSDPAIAEAYEEIVSGQATNWLILGYHDTRDKISLYAKGAGGLEELRNNLKEEVLYGFLRIESKFVLLTYVSEHVSGVRKARALVHGRAVGTLFKAAQAQINASNPNDLSEVNVRNRLKLASTDDRPSSPAPGRKNVQDQSGPTPASPKSPLPPPTPKATLPPPTPKATLPPPTPKATLPPEATSDAGGRDEAERWAREEAERQERERDAAARRDAERVAREAAAQRQRAEEDRRRQEALENAAKEKAAAEARAKETARKAAEHKRNEEIRNRAADLEKSGKVLISGYITVQGGDVYFWKRRWFELRGKTLYLYRDGTDKLPISKIELDGEATNVEDAQSEVLILNSFKIDFRNSEPYYFFSDDRKAKEDIVAALRRYVK